MKKRIMLYFGSFNPIHKGHMALAEYALTAGLCDEIVLIVSPQSPYKQGCELASEMHRFEMAEIACKASKDPQRIKASAVEFLLPKPSYTIDTLRFLEEQCGGQMQFSLLMGADQIDALDGWKQSAEILKYPIYVYPRRGVTPSRHLDRVTLLNEAPLQEFSATEVRRCIGLGDDTASMLDAGVAAYILSKELWGPEARIAALTAQIDAIQQQTEIAAPNTAPPCGTAKAGGGRTPAGEDQAAEDREAAKRIALYIERGRIHYRMNAWGPALNDFNRALQIDDANAEAQQFAAMAQEILEFRYTDIYNP